MQLADAIRWGNDQASHNGLAVIVWSKLAKEWQLLNSWHTADNCEPEFLCLGLGLIPCPLTDIAEQSLLSLLKEVAHET
jgi:hypothetical protein